MSKLEAFKGRITIVPGATNDRQGDSAGCRWLRRGPHRADPLGGSTVFSGTAQAVLDYAQPGARLIFSCGWHITRDGQDVYSRSFKAALKAAGWIGKLLRAVEIDDQVEACQRVFASPTRWTVVRGSDLEEGESQGLPVWSGISAIPFSRAI